METITQIQYQSIPAYLTALKDKATQFGRATLTAYNEPQTFVLGFRCQNEIHIVGLNIIRGHYNIERILPNIPGLISISRRAIPAISQEMGLKMFIDDCKKALEGSE